jgi:hypothetical protein
MTVPGGASWTGIERISIELSQRCGMGCSFCYSASTPAGETRWTEDEVVRLATDCAAHGTRAVSFGGGEPLEVPWLGSLLARLDGVAFRSVTTNGLPLADRGTLADLVRARPDKVHVSIHAPGSDAEVERVIAQVRTLADLGVASGVNLLVRKSALAEATRARAALDAAGIAASRIVLLPMRGHDTPTPEEVAAVARGPFQSMTCLVRCGKSPRFCAVGWDRSVAWCSYTRSRAPLQDPTFAALARALEGLDVEPCAGGLTPLRTGRDA